MGGISFTTVVAYVVKSAIVGGAKSMFIGPLVVIGAGSGGVDEEVLGIVVFKSCELTDF
jgi:hypothetical protein